MSKQWIHLRKFEDALNNIQNKYDELTNENGNNLEKISALEKEVKSLKKNLPYLKCEECQYPADILCELGEHMLMTHQFKDSDEANYCNYCGGNLKQKIV